MIEDKIPASLDCDVVQCMAFLQQLRPHGPWVLTRITPDGSAPTITRTFDVPSSSACAQFISASNATGHNVYYTINPVRALVRKKPTKADISGAEFVQVDADPSDAETAEEFKTRFLPILKAFVPPPSFVIDSGNGIQVLWRLEGSVSDVAAIESANKALLRALAAPSGTHNIDRLFRLPGTINWPNAKKKKLGRIACMSSLIECNECVYAMRDFPASQTDEGEQARSNRPSRTGLPRRLTSMLHVNGAGSYQSRSEALFAFVSVALRQQVAESTIVAACLDPSYEGKGIHSHVIQNGGEPYLKRQIENAKAKAATGQRDISIDDFRAYMPQHNYIYMPTREPWLAASVDARLGRIPVLDENGTPVADEQGRAKLMQASSWLDKHRPVEQMAWMPGEEHIVGGRLLAEGGWIVKDGARILNLYRPPNSIQGDPCKAQRWIDHIYQVYGSEADHIIKWLAFRVQNPGIKINHALVLGGEQGIGKDTILEPVKRAIGHWNFAEVSPQQIMGRFNGFLKSLILRVSEAKDEGDINRYQFYEHMKTIIAAPPDVLRCDEKNLREHSVLNVTGVVITTNYKTNGIYLPAGDRRHFVAWSPCRPTEFTEGYWSSIWKWYSEEGGISHVAAYLLTLDLTGFNAKAPPPKTAAFWDIVDSNQAPENAELADLFDKMKNPAAVTLAMIRDATSASNQSLGDWIRDRKNRRIISLRFQEAGYVPVRNTASKDGYWTIDGERQAIYAKQALPVNEQIAAARELQNRRPRLPI